MWGRVIIIMILLMSCGNKFGLIRLEVFLIMLNLSEKMVICNLFLLIVVVWYFMLIYV